MQPRIRLHLASRPSRRRRAALYALIRASHGIYKNRSLRHKWIKARLILGSQAPKVRMGREEQIAFPRTRREAGWPV